MIWFECGLLLLLIAVGIAAMLQKNLLNTVLVFMAFGLVMSVIWILLRSPDLAITEAAVGAGVTGVLFILTLQRIEQLKEEDDKDEK